MHTRLISLVLIGCTTFILFSLQQLAQAYYLYWRFWWFDNLLHFIGGFIIGALALWYLTYEAPGKFRNVSWRVALSLFAFLVAGTAWEIFEYVANVPRETAYATDVVSDMIMGTLGTMVAQFLFVRYGK